MKRSMLTVATVVTLLAASAQPASGDTATVTMPANPHGWYFSSDHTAETGVVTTTTGAGGITEDEAGGRPGPGSYLLSVEVSQKARLETLQFNDKKLGDLVSFAYSTNKTGMTGYAPSINVMIDPSGSESFDGSDDFATVVWEANKAGFTVTDGIWQDWDTTTSAGTSTGGWWSPSISTQGAPGANNVPVQLDALVDFFGADSEILSVAVNVGRHGPMTAHVDGVSVTTTDGTSSFDFEMGRTPASKDDCKGGGWLEFNAPEFKNQGQCVSFLAADQE